MDNKITHHLDAMDARLSRIESKLDTHLERVGRAEKDIEWLKGHVKMATVVFLGVTGTLGTLLLRYLFPTK